MLHYILESQIEHNFLKPVQTHFDSSFVLSSQWLTPCFSTACNSNMLCALDYLWVLWGQKGELVAFSPLVCEQNTFSAEYLLLILVEWCGQRNVQDQAVFLLLNYSVLIREIFLCFLFLPNWRRETCDPQQLNAVSFSQTKIVEYTVNSKYKYFEISLFIVINYSL